MINISTVLAALKTQLDNNSSVTSLLKFGSVTRSDFVNNNANNTPWVGVYRGKVQYVPRTLGNILNWEAMPQFKVVCQGVNFKGAQEAEVTLENLIEKVISAVIANPTIGGTVEMLTGYNVEYMFQETNRQDLFFQTAVITFDFEAKTA